jgi:hypothetical protein
VAWFEKHRWKYKFMTWYMRHRIMSNGQKKARAIVKLIFACEPDFSNWTIWSRLLHSGYLTMLTHDKKDIFALVALTSHFNCNVARMTLICAQNGKFVRVTIWSNNISWWSKNGKFVYGTFVICGLVWKTVFNMLLFSEHHNFMTCFMRHHTMSSRQKNWGNCKTYFYIWT